jgi:UDP-glucuronate 4-epimerase
MCFAYFLCIFLFFVQTSDAQKTVLVTGGAGFIGGHVVQKLLERQDKVIVIQKPSDFPDTDNFFTSHEKHAKEYSALKRSKVDNLQKKYSGELIIHSVDIIDKEALETVFQTYAIDVVCHLGAIVGVRYSLQDPDLYLKTNVIGTSNLFECMKKYSVSRCVLASSSSVYGESTQKIFYETQDTDRHTSLYAVSKKTTELLAYVYYHLHDIETTCLRFFTVYGPYSCFDMAPFLFMDAIAQERPITVLGDGLAVRDFSFIDDIVDGIIKAIDIPLGYEIINISSPDSVTVMAFIGAIEKAVGKKAIIQYKPSNRSDVSFTHASIEKAQNLLGYTSSVGLTEGLQKMYDWYKSEPLFGITD